MISWIHWNLGAVRPYLPETNGEYPAPEPGHQVDWRASALPSWHGPSDVNASFWSSPDNKKHRWLPVRGKSDHVLDKTPIMETQYDAFGTGLQRWQVAAQEHYSFFENLEARELWRYKFNVWDFQRLRMGIQFIAMMGHDINAAKPIHKDDEEHFSVTMPKKLGRGKPTAPRVAPTCGIQLLTLRSRCRGGWARRGRSLQLWAAIKRGRARHDRYIGSLSFLRQGECLRGSYAVVSIVAVPFLFHHATLLFFKRRRGV